MGVDTHTKRAIAVSLAVLHLWACSTWQTTNTAPEQILAQQQPDRIRVTMTDGSEFVLLKPRIQGDSLAGLALFDVPLGAGRPATEPTPTSVALEEIRHVAVERSNQGTRLLAGVVLIGLVIVAVVAGMSMGP